MYLGATYSQRQTYKQLLWIMIICRTPFLFTRLGRKIKLTLKQLRILKKKHVTKEKIEYGLKKENGD
jgi:hypothetical protein